MIALISNVAHLPIAVTASAVTVLLKDNCPRRLL